MKTSRKNSKQRSRQLKKHAKRLAAYSAAAAATVMTTGDRSANAAEVVWNIGDITVRDDGGDTQRGVVFNMTNGATEINRPFGGPDPNGTLPDLEGYWPSRGVFRLTAAYGGYIYMPSYQPDPNGSLTLPYERPPGTGPIDSGASAGWAVGFAGTGRRALPYLTSSLIGITDQQFVMDGPYRGQSYYAEVDFLHGTTAHVGMHFKIPAAGDPNGPRVSHFGWALITNLTIGSVDFEFTLHSFGYNDTPGAASHPPPVVGDLNGDRVVDEADKDIFKLWHLADLDPNDDFDEDVAASRGDLSDPIDFQNNIEDFALFKPEFEFFKSRASLEVTNVGALRASESSSASVPEPSSVLLLAAGATGLGIWRRRKQV